jgi:hypothetical protein
LGWYIIIVALSIGWIARDWFIERRQEELELGKEMMKNNKKENKTTPGSHPRRYSLIV